MAALTSPVLRAALLGALCLATPLHAQSPLVSRSAQGVEVNLVQVEIAAAIASLAPYLDRPVFYGALGSQRITFTSPRPIPQNEIPGLLRSILAENGYLMEESEGAYRIRAREQAAAPGPPVPQMQPQFGGPPPGSGGMELFVIRLRHARAADVAATVSALYGRGGALGEAGLSRGTLSNQLRDNRIPEYGQQAPQVSAAGDASGRLRGDLTIVPDPRTNSLLIRAARADFELVRAAVEQVDVRPLQVLIETTVAYVSRSYVFGLGLSARTDTFNIPGRGVGLGRTSAAAGGTGLVLEALGIGGIDLNLVLSAGERRDHVLIVDRPLVLATNNEEAEIVVGEQRPFVQLERTTDGGVQDQVIQYKDVGTTLRVLPTISEDGFVQLQVLQEVNSATGASGLNGAPVISTRSVSTRLLVRDGRTAVLGGLSATQRGRSSEGIPFLSRLPLIGAAFGRKGRDSNDFELFIFITPHVINSDERLEDATDDVRRNGGRAGREADRRRPLLTPDREGATPQGTVPSAAPNPAVPNSPVPGANPGPPVGGPPAPVPPRP